MEECVFCKIRDKEIPAEIVRETATLIIFKDINPKAKTHLLIVPKKHIESIKTVNEEDKEILGEMLLIAKKLGEEFQIPGFKLQFNVGREGGQEVDHLHLHFLAEKEIKN